MDPGTRLFELWDVLIQICGKMLKLIAITMKHYSFLTLQNVSHFKEYLNVEDERFGIRSVKWGSTPVFDGWGAPNCPARAVLCKGLPLQLLKAQFKNYPGNR